jgi:hypothetical protein
MSFFPTKSRYDRVREQVVTDVNKCDGNLFKLREDLDKVPISDKSVPQVALIEKAHIKGSIVQMTLKMEQFFLEI